MKLFHVIAKPEDRTSRGSPAGYFRVGNVAGAGSFNGDLAFEKMSQFKIVLTSA